MNQTKKLKKVELGKAVFWDRDGVLNHVLPERDDGAKHASPQKFEDFKLVAGIADVLWQIKQAGFLNIVVTNQPDIAHNKMSWDELNKMHNFLKQQAPEIDAIYVCPHKDGDNCACRKPKPGLLLDAAKDYHLDLANSFMVGDRQKDIDAGKNAGVKSILLKQTHNTEVKDPDFVTESLAGIIEIVK